MLDYIKFLPLELQSKILDEIPEFTRLSKNDVAGKIYLESLFSKNISFDEFNKYIKIHKPDRYFYYHYEKGIDHNIFTISENFYEFGLYRTIYHNFYYNDKDNKITMYITHKWDHNYNYSMKTVKFDLQTVYNIYKYYRKEYVNIDKVVLNYFNENLIKYQTNNTFINDIIQTNYFYSNKLNINDSKRLSVLTSRLSHMVNNSTLSHSTIINELNKDKISKYINNIKLEISPEIYKYIENLK